MKSLVLLSLPKLSLFLAGLLGIAYTSACVALYLRQTRMLFLPSPVIETTPAAYSLRYEEVWIPVRQDRRQDRHQDSASEKLHGWWIPNRSTDAPVLLLLHGNAINIGANLGQAARFHSLGFSVLLADYRGYGRSEGGFPNEQQAYQDAEAMWHYLTVDRQISPSQIVIYGHSLGGAIGIELATHHSDAAALLVESSFTSIREMVDRTMPFGIFPIDLLLTQRFNSIQKVATLQVPVLFIHGLNDQRTFSDMSEALYSAAPEPKQLYWVAAAGHNDVAEVAGDDYFETIRNFLQSKTTLLRTSLKHESGHS
ncbi:alpha/beta hydrolase [Phormidium tenue FACHB-886]|nr:alpha/beta hydrolase [Phormidium tenue FACHB-886]